MRRSKDSAFGDLLDFASKLSWKVSLGAAVIAFVALHIVAQLSTPVAGNVGLQGIGGLVLRQFVHVFAMFLQFIMPAGFLIGAAVSIIKRSRSRELFDSDWDPPGRKVASLTWQEFERLVAEGFRQRGFQVTERGGAGPDGGVDLELARGGERHLVQCKHWRAQQVGVSVVRELYGSMAAERAAGGYVVTSGSFTRDANEFSVGRNIELMDGRGLAALLCDAQAMVKPIDSMPAVNMNAPKAPSCPECQSTMVLRVAKRGAHVGRAFWGCARYPKCRAIIERE
jgi:restriction system protein